MSAYWFPNSPSYQAVVVIVEVGSYERVLFQGCLHDYLLCLCHNLEQVAVSRS